MRDLTDCTCAGPNAPPCPYCTYLDSQAELRLALQSKASRVYRGYRPGSNVVIISPGDPHAPPLPWRLDLRDHSPTGLEWGYGGSGPAQLALAILADAIGPQFALEHYIDYKWHVVSKLPYTGWEIEAEQVRDLGS